MNVLRELSPYLLTLLVGVVGGLLALFMKFPIPWMLGSLILCAVGKLAGLPIRSVPGNLERWMRVAIGVSLGPAVAASMQHSQSELPFAIVAAIVVTSLTIAVGMPWFERRVQLPRSAAFMSSLPGGLSMLLALAGDIGNRPQVMLVHSVRVVIVVVSISLLARALGVPPEPDALLASLNWSNETSPWVLVGLVVVCFFFAEKLHFAGSHVLVPMVVTALVTVLTGISVVPPPLLKTVALLVFGIVIGQEVANGPRSQYLRLFTASSLFTIVAMGMGALGALLLANGVDQGFMVLFLALAPGGIAEVSLVALALGLDAGMVALVHSCRFIYITTLGPIGLRFFQRRENE